MYTSKIIRVAKNTSQILELPFTAHYVYLYVGPQQQIPAGAITISLDDGEEIAMISGLFQLDYDFTKIRITVGPLNVEDVQLFYFISGKENKEKAVLEELQTKVKELKNLTGGRL